jgi:hypothetical protein
MDATQALEIAELLGQVRALGIIVFLTLLVNTGIIIFNCLTR